MKLLEALNIANAPQDGPELRVLLACGFTPLHFETALKAHLRLMFPDRAVRITRGLYGDIAQTIADAEAGLDGVTVALEWADLDPRLGWRSVATVASDLIEDARLRMSRISDAIETVALKCAVAVSMPVLPLPPVFNSASTELDRIHASLCQMLYAFAATTNATVVLPRERESAVHDLRMELLADFPYTFAHAETAAKSLAVALFPAQPKKGLITDLDETLWSGVLGDDGPEGIAWDLDRHSQFHAAYQRLLNGLADRGILLAVASKNDPELVTKALKREDLIIAPTNLFPIEAGWASKIDSVRRILHKWNIADDCVVFVDDSAFELAQIQTAFPAMQCFQFQQDNGNFLNTLNDQFVKRGVTEEDRLRVKSLRAAESFHDTSDSAESFDRILQRANARIVARWSKVFPDNRALELINKTNQFNLNGRRYTEAEWIHFIADPNTRVLVLEYEDRFAKLGKIAVVAGREHDDTFTITTWVMSCRAFSRRIEHKSLSLVFRRWNDVEAQYRQTERNGPIQAFLEQLGWNCTSLSRDTFELTCPPLFQEVEIHVNE